MSEWGLLVAPGPLLPQSGVASRHGQEQAPRSDEHEKRSYQTPEWTRFEGLHLPRPDWYLNVPPWKIVTHVIDDLTSSSTTPSSARGMPIIKVLVRAGELDCGGVRAGRRARTPRHACSREWLTADQSDQRGTKPKQRFIPFHQSPQEMVEPN